MKKFLYLLLLTSLAASAFAAPPNQSVHHKAKPRAAHVRQAGTAPAQAGTVSLIATPNSTNGTTAVTLAWLTSVTADGVAASSCAASGGWSGAQAASGSVTTPVVTATTTYTLTCTWNDTTSVLAWSNPTTLNNGAAFTDQSGVNVYGGTAPTGLKKIASLTGKPTTDTLTGQAVGTNYYAITAVGTSEGEGAASATVSKANGAGSASAQAVVTVVAAAAIPEPPTNLTAQ